MGLTVIPRDVTVTGTLNVTDSEGKVHTIDVAGTLDLLAYDQEGNFYIYDMKTVRSSIEQHKEEKYARQLSLYKKFLENTYGINVKSLNIIPIHVEYPEPKGWKNSTNEYTVIEGNQLAINGEEYRNAKPQLFRPKEVGYREPNIQYEKLTDIEKRQTLTKEEQEILNKSPRDSQGRLLAPNGKKSNLTERQYAQVRTKAFKDWFGDWENANKENPYSKDISIGSPEADFSNVDGTGTGVLIPIFLNGEYIGETGLDNALYHKDKGMSIKGKYMEMPSVGGSNITIEKEYRGKGYGKATYFELAKLAANNGKILRSAPDKSRTPASTRVWESLVRDGYAKRVNDRY